MAFIPVKYSDGQYTHLPAAASTAFIKGNAIVDNGSGYITNSAGTETRIRYVCAETVTTSSATGELVKVISTKNVLFEADTDANPAQTDVGTLADLATVSTINPDASTNDCFFVESIKGPVTDNKVLGYFTEGETA